MKDSQFATIGFNPQFKGLQLEQAISAALHVKTIVYEPEAEVEFTEAEVAELFNGAIDHYDYKCQETAVRGGTLWGIRNRLENGVASTYLKFRELDILAKVSESPAVSIDLHRRLCCILQVLSNARELVNTP